MMPESCCFPNCHAALSRRVHVPLCDAHAVKVYRSVAEVMAEVDPYTFASFEGGGRADLHRTTRTGLVYFMRFGDRVKIGFTTNLPQRCREVPHDEVLATMPGSMHDERAMHQRFAKHRLHHEWFALHPEILEYVEGLNAAA